MDRDSTNLGSYRPGAVGPGGGYSTGGSGGGGSSGPGGLLDVLDRVLDKGLVIAGDIRINLLDIELLTIKVRLLISSADKAKEMGIDWWTRDPYLSTNAQRREKQLADKQPPDKQLDVERENKALRERVERLESQLKALTERSNGASTPRLPHAAGTGAGAPARRG